MPTINPGVYTGIIKDNGDNMGMGRVRVFIPSFGGDPSDETAWYSVSYMSPHGGQTNPYLNKKGGKQEVDAQDSYGMWATGYHLENEVLVNFMSGDPSSGMIMGGMFQQNMAHSMGGYASGESSQGKVPKGIFGKKRRRPNQPNPPPQPEFSDINPPVVEYNKRDTEVNPRAPIRPRNERLYRQLAKQGLLTDPMRGNVSTSPMRDGVPQFISMKTARGNFFVIDDGKLAQDSGAGVAGVNSRQYARQPGGGSSMIRLRAEGGTQTVINDDCGFLHMISSEGSSYAQLSNAGVQLYSEGSIAMRVEGNYNLRVDGDYNSEVQGVTEFKVGGNMNWSTDGSMAMLDIGNGIRLQALGDYNEKVGQDIIETAAVFNTRSAGGSMIKYASMIQKYVRGNDAHTVTPFVTTKVKDSNIIRQNQPMTGPGGVVPSGLGMTPDSTTSDSGLITRKVNTMRVDPDGNPIMESYKGGSDTKGVPIGNKGALDYSGQPIDAPNGTEGESILPEGGFITHQPWNGNAQACGKPADPAEQGEIQEAVANGEFTEGVGGSSAAELNELNDMLIADGYSPEARAAILGTVAAESGGNPNAVGDNGHAHGLFQWRDDNGRYQLMQQYTADNGLDPNSVRGQYEFFKAESSGYGEKIYGVTDTQLRNASTVDGAMAAMKNYERYGRAGSRYTYAQDIYNIIGR